LVFVIIAMKYPWFPMFTFYS